MYVQQTQLKNKSGLHARPASDFVMAAKAFTSKITVRNLDNPEAAAANAKSIVSLLAQGMGQGTKIEIAANGDDEKTAAEKLAALVESGFGEE